MALTDAQWAQTVADIVARLVDGSITEVQAASELATATADWPTRTLSNADLAARVSRFLARLNGLILTDGTPDITLGELNTFAYDTTNGILYGPKTAGGWGAGVSLVGPEGQSAKDLVIAAGELPANATDADFATWLANAQVAAVQAAVQPMVDDAEGARDAAQAARTGAETAETNAETAAASAAADADATDADRASVASDKATVAADRQTAQDAAATATTKAGEASGSADDADAARLASEGARDASAAAQQAAEAARDEAAGHVTTAAGHATAADASADAAAADAVQTGADRTATGADRAAAEAAAGLATDKADAAALSATAAQTAQTGSETARDASQAAQAAAEQARDEAQAIAGGDFQPLDPTLTSLATLNATAGVVVQTGADTFTKRAIGASAGTSILDRDAGDARYAQPNYVNSRGQNLVTNGTGLLRSNQNFSAFTFDGSDGYFSTGSFTNETYDTSRVTDELIPINPDLTYRLTVYAKASPATGARNYIGIIQHDADGLSISPHFVMWSSPVTTLAADLKPGDTTITLTDATGWNATSAGTHQRGFITWDYINAGGKIWPELTYSRNAYLNLWAADSAVNVSTGVVTLSSPWTGRTIPAGTKLSRSNSGSIYKYTAASNAQFTENWQSFSGTIGGVETPGSNDSLRFAISAASVKLVFLLNRDVAGSKTWLSNISFGIDLATKDDLKGKAPLASPAFTGTPTAPTAAVGTNTTQIANTAFVKAAIDALIAGAPTALDTLKEIADALAADDDAIAAVMAAIPVKASGAELRTATNDDKFLTPKSVADAAALVALTDAATIAVDLAAGTNFTVTLAGNRTLGAPSNAKPGMSGTILIKQDATGSRTLAYNTAWKPFGSTPALSTAANAVDLLTWIVETSDKVRFTLAKGGTA